MSLIDKFRPQKWEDVIGQDHIVKVLQKVAEHPNDYPKNFIFNGGFGTGKTTCARLFQKSLPNSFLLELDVSEVGNIESMKDIKATIDHVFSFSSDYRFIIFDEIQEASKKSQSLLLKTLEDNLGVNLFFIFCTTDKSKIIDTIRSRCIELDFKLIGTDDITKTLVRIIGEEKIVINEHDLDLIVRKANGHLRNAISYLDKYNLDPDNFKYLMLDSTDALKKYIFDVDKGNVNDIMAYPVSVLSSDLNYLMSVVIQRKIDTQSIYCVRLLELYMKYKHSIDSVEDVISVLNILRKITFTELKNERTKVS